MEGGTSGSPYNDTYFAKAGRRTQQEIAGQMRLALEDPCVKIVLDAVTGFVLILNEERQILTANQELLDALAHPDSGAVAGLRPGEVFNCVHFTEGPGGCGTSKRCRACGAVLTILASQNSGEAAEGECRLSMYREGKLTALELRVRATPLNIDGHRLTAFVLNDVSDLKRREVLEQAFLHEFLNMIGGIAGWSELLKKADQHTAAREIAALAASLKEEIVNQRTLLLAERGELAVKQQEFDVREFLSRLEMVFSRHPVAEGKKLLALPLPERTRVTSDPLLLMRVASHMLKNAFEATGPGGVVRLGFEWKGDRPAFSVHNAGVIPESVQQRLFERSFSTRAEEGRGIGTYSMKLYGERYLGAEVSFTSSETNGTTFSILLPAQQAPATPAAGDAAAKAKPGPRRVLFVDDDEALLNFGKLVLTRLGYSAAAYRSGVEALEAFQADPGAFDIVLTDWNMPKMSGAKLVERLREISADVPILVCTGMGDSPAKDADTARIQGYVAKPFTFQELAQALEKSLSRRNE